MPSSPGEDDPRGAAACWESTAPGRLCLFGEHQDYLGLPVVAVALPLHCRIQVEPRTDRILRLAVVAPDGHENSTRVFDLDRLPPPPGRVCGIGAFGGDEGSEGQRDDPGAEAANDDDASSSSIGGGLDLDVTLAVLHEFRAIVTIEKWQTLRGADCLSFGDLPWQAGCSSSSAFVVAWSQVLYGLCFGVDGEEEGEAEAWTPLELAKLAHRAEVLHFKSPGGTMDHVTSALGGMLRIGAGDDPLWSHERFSFDSSSFSSLGVWVLANSGEPKDTLRHLRRCKDARLELLERLGGMWDLPGDHLPSSLTDDDRVLWEATRVNRDTEAKAAELLRRRCGVGHTEGDETRVARLGHLLNEHHAALRDGLGLSTPCLEALRSAALGAGAHGFKLVGSGGGGCGVAWIDADRAPSVASAMEEAGATRTWIVSEPARGAHIVRLGPRHGECVLST